MHAGVIAQSSATPNGMMASMRVWLVSLLHLVAVLSIAHLYSSGVQRQDGECKVYTTCSYPPVKLVDLLSPSILQIELTSSLYWFALVTALIYTLFILYKIQQALVGTPDIVIKPAERDIGYLQTPGKTKREIANMVRKRRVVGDIPPPYPNGWYEVMRSSDLPPGSSKAIFMNGLHLAVFRSSDEKKQVFVTDAYCPHLGANLGVGGRVNGSCIECPFHGWQFDGETGQCTSVPYASKAPSFVKIKVWPSKEVNGLILVWYDAEGRDPYFMIPEIPEIKSGRWAYRGRSVHYINCHLEDISENGADISHLKAVHETGIPAGSETEFRKSTWLGRIITHEWEVKWYACEPPRAHVGHMELKLVNKLFGRWRIKPLDFFVSVDQVGPGVVLLYFKNFIGKGIFIQTDVPEEPLLQRLTHYIYCDWWIPTFLTIGLQLRAYATQIERDALVWVNKRYVANPSLVKEDQLILAHRRWFQQFYSENSIKMTFKNDSDLSW